VKRFIDTLATVGYVLARAPGDPLMLALMSSGGSTSFDTPTDAFEGMREYPGFSLSVPGLPSSPRTFVVYAPADTLRGTAADAGVTYVGSGSTTTTLGARSGVGSTYRLSWDDDAFGPGSPFVLKANPQMQTAFDASLAARAGGTYTDTSQVYRTAFSTGT